MTVRGISISSDISLNQVVKMLADFLGTTEAEVMGNYNNYKAIINQLCYQIALLEEESASHDTIDFTLNSEYLNSEYYIIDNKTYSSSHHQKSQVGSNVVMNNINMMSALKSRLAMIYGLHSLANPLNTQLLKEGAIASSLKIRYNSNIKAYAVNDVGAARTAAY